MHFIPTIIASAHSKYSGEIRVVEGLGFRHLSTDSIQHSGGIMTEIWQTALKPYAQKNKSWLVLGVAGGSVFKLILQKYRPKKMTGIDIDSMIIDLGRKYFSLDKIKNLEIIIGDARKIPFDHCDYILVDLFGRDSCPEFIYTSKFLNKLFISGSKIFINHLYNSPKNKSKFNKLVAKIKTPPQIHYIRQNAVLVI